MKNKFIDNKRGDKITDIICIQCGEPAIANCYSESGRKEVFISGFCEKCFDALFKEKEMNYEPGREC